jgi:hypothetical protein
VSIDPKRPYPEGIAWDEAWRQRQRADTIEDGCDSLSRLLRIGCKIAEQDGEWWLWEKGGEGVVGAKTLAGMLRAVATVDVEKYEREYDERCRRYMERTRNIDTLGW